MKDNPQNITKAPTATEVIKLKGKQISDIDKQFKKHTDEHRSNIEKFLIDCWRPWYG